MLNLVCQGAVARNKCLIKLELLVLQLALQLLRLCHLADCFIKVILIDRITVVPNCEQTTMNRISIDPKHA